MKPDEPSHVVIVQAIMTRWTKASRGAPGSMARNHAPEAVELPADPPSASWPKGLPAPEILPQPATLGRRAPDIVLHLIAYNECDQFEAPVAQHWAALTSRLPELSELRLPDRHVPPITLIADSDKIQVEFSWHEVPGKPPRRHLHRRERIRLGVGQCMRIRFNARHTDSDGRWYYEKHVINIGFVHGLYRALFVAGSPDFTISDMAALR